jgi:hypothetical protein
MSRYKKIKWFTLFKKKNPVILRIKQNLQVQNADSLIVKAVGIYIYI